MHALDGIIAGHQSVQEGRSRAITFHVSDVQGLALAKFPNLHLPLEAAKAILSTASAETSQAAHDMFNEHAERLVLEYLHRGRPEVNPYNGSQLVKLALCESRHLLLKPGVTYRFEVIPGCDECERLAAEERGDDPGPMG